MKTAVWIQAARPKTLIASISPVLIGSAMAMKEGSFSLWIFCFLLLVGIGIQISTNLANDWLDFVKGADTKGRKGPPRVTQQGLVSVQQIRKMTLLSTCFTAIASLPLIWEGGAWIAGLVVLALLFAIGYTGGPIPLAYVGLGDLCVLLFFGPVATGCAYFLHTHALSYASILIGFCPGLLSCALLALNNLRDEEEDRKSRKKTLIVRFGSRLGKRQVLFCLLVPPLLPMIVCQGHLFVLLTLLCLLPAIVVGVEMYRIENLLHYNPLFGKVGKLFAFYTFIFCTSWML
jgi:1,4-dihydroxy-2-naphthoate octaprenyltransferase